MNQLEAKELSAIFSDEGCKYSKCSDETQINVVRIQFVIDPIAKKVNDAIDIAKKTLVSPRLKELIEKASAGEISQYTKEASELNSLNEKFESSFKKAMDEIHNVEVKDNIKKLTMAEWKELRESNKEYFAGSTPMKILKLLVDMDTSGDDENTSKQSGKKK